MQKCASYKKQLVELNDKNKPFTELAGLLGHKVVTGGIPNHSYFLSSMKISRFQQTFDVETIRSFVMNRNFPTVTKQQVPNKGNYIKFPAGLHTEREQIETFRRKRMYQKTSFII